MALNGSSTTRLRNAVIAVCVVLLALFVVQRFFFGSSAAGLAACDSTAARDSIRQTVEQNGVKFLDIGDIEQVVCPQTADGKVCLKLGANEEYCNATLYLSTGTTPANVHLFIGPSGEQLVELKDGNITDYSKPPFNVKFGPSDWVYDHGNLVRTGTSVENAEEYEQARRNNLLVPLGKSESVSAFEKVVTDPQGNRYKVLPDYMKVNGHVPFGVPLPGSHDRTPPVHGSSQFSKGGPGTAYPNTGPAKINLTAQPMPAQPPPPPNYAPPTRTADAAGPTTAVEGSNNGTAIGAQTDNPRARRVSKCVLKVDNKSYIDGPCEYAASAEGGFAIYGYNKWFAIVDVKGGAVSGNWNNDSGYPASHAQDDLGPLSRNGACFVGPRARVCAYQ